MSPHDRTRRVILASYDISNKKGARFNRLRRCVAPLRRPRDRTSALLLLGPTRGVLRLLEPPLLLPR
eukprot:scaffold30076_cov66-Phaeocystis_antarctica.AAC.2